MNIVKLFFKYINEFIDEEKLLEELGTYYANLSDDKYKKSINSLTEEIKIAIEDHKNNSVVKYDAIYNLLINNEIYLELIKQMNDNDVMLMITEYIKCRVFPSINQEYFDRLIDAAINSGKDSKENCWRLAMTYEYSDLNLDKIEDYLISVRDVYYIVELLSAVDTIDKDKITDKIINTNDIAFIKGILNDNFTIHALNEEQIEKIKIFLANN